MKPTRWNRGISHLILAACILLLACSCIGNQSEAAKQFALYSEASVSHDLSVLGALTAEDIVWQLGPRRLEGKQEVLGPNAFDKGAEATLTYRNVSVEGNRVEFELVETSDIIRAVGMTALWHFPRFEFQNGLVSRKAGSWKEPPDIHSMKEFGQRMAPLREWIRETHPDAIPRLVNSDRSFIFSEESGALMLRLAREWVASGAPGRLTTQ
jgi:hypothetical protein